MPRFLKKRKPRLLYTPKAFHTGKLFLFCTVNRLAEHEKTLVEELRGEIQ